MRTFASCFTAALLFLLPASGAGAAGTDTGHLESVSLLAAGEGSSVALRTSIVTVLVAATAADAQTVVIELVGITGDRRAMAVSDSSGMISHLAIDTVGSAGSEVVTRIKVSLARPFRHRVRLSGQVVYVDFERVDRVEPRLELAEARAPRAGRSTAGAARPTPPPQPVDRVARQVLPPQPAERAARSVLPPQPADRVTSPVAPAAVSRAASAIPPRPATALDAASAAVARAEGSSAAPVPPLPSAQPTNEVSLLSRWVSITESWLQNLIPSSTDTVSKRAWMPLVLSDGTTVVSHGDHTEVAGQVMLLLPFDDADAPRVEAVTVPASAIDPGATARAVESVKAARYALTRGPEDFAQFSREISAILDDVPSQPDPAVRVSLAEGVRRRLIEWPAAHYGYRSHDVYDAVDTLDPILTQLRSAAGMNRFDVTLSTPRRAQQPAVGFRQPTLVDLIENAMRFVSMLPAPAERIAVLRATSDSLQRHRDILPPVWLATGQRRVAEALQSEARIDEAYRKLSTDLLGRAERAAREGDVRKVARLQNDLVAGDRRLGGRREDVLQSTTAALQAQFDLAAQKQLLHDRRALAAREMRAYADEIAPALKRFEEVRDDLQQMAMTVAPPSKVRELRDAIAFVKRKLAEYPPPRQMEEAHGLVLAATQLADRAMPAPAGLLRPMDGATGARASAAADAIVMFERGRRAIETSLRLSLNR